LQPVPSTYLYYCVREKFFNFLKVVISTKHYGIVEFSHGLTSADYLLTHNALVLPYWH